MISEPRKIYLDKAFRGCPDYWKKFFYSQLLQTGRYGSASIEEVNDKLEPWNGTIVEYSNGHHAIEFDTDEDKLLFMLRWS